MVDRTYTSVIAKISPIDTRISGKVGDTIGQSQLLYLNQTNDPTSYG
jgi:hypothetical protein